MKREEGGNWRLFTFLKKSVKGKGGKGNGY